MPLLATGCRDRLGLGLLAVCAAACGLVPPVATQLSPNDYVSALPPPSSDAMNAGVSLECDRRSLTTVADADGGLAATAYPHMDVSEDPVGPVMLSAWGNPAQPRFVLVDAARGVRVVDGSDPSRPRVSGSLAVPGAPLQLAVVDSKALLAFARGTDEYELWWIDLAAPSGPALLHRAIARGEVRGAYVVSSGDRPSRVIVVVDTFDDKVACAPRKGTVLREISLDDASVRAELPLGAGVTGVSHRGDFLFIVDAVTGRSPPGSLESVRVVDLATPNGELVASAPLTFGDGVRALHAEGRSVRVVWSTWRQDENSQVAGVRTYHLARLRLADRGELALEGACEKSVAGPGIHGAWPIAESENQIAFLRDRTVLYFPRDLTQVNAWVFREGSCTPAEHTLLGHRFMASPDRSRLVSLASGVPRVRKVQRRGGPDIAEPMIVAEDANHILHVRLYDPERLPTPVASAEVALARRAGQDPCAEGDGYQREAAALLAWPARERPPGGALLAVPFREREATVERTGSQLFLLSDARIVAGAKLGGMLWRAPASAPAVVNDDSGLEFVKLDDPAAPVSLGEIELWPTYLRAAFIEGGFARLRAPSPTGRRDPLTGRPEARLELVPAGGEPQTTPAVATFPLTPAAQLTRVGSLLVTSSRGYHVEGEKGPPCRFEVFDVHDLRAAHRTAASVSDALCDGDHGLDNQPVLALPNALVFARTERTHDRGEITVSRFALFVLDLRDPSHPRWHGPFRTPREEWASRTFVRGLHVLYAYRLAHQARGATRPDVSYYLRDIDFSDPSEPQFGAPMSVAGEPLAIDDSGIYTRDFVRSEAPCADCTHTGGPTTEAVVRKLAWHEGKAELLASYVVGGDEVASISAAYGRLVAVDLHVLPAGQPSWVIRKTRVAVLDAATLQPQGETILDLPAMGVAQSGLGSLYVTAAHDLRVLSLDDPAQPRFRTVLPETVVADTLGTDVLLLRAGVLHLATTLRLAPE